MFGPYELMLLAAAMLLSLHDAHPRRPVEMNGYRGVRPRTFIEPERDGRGGFALLLRDRYLLSIGLSVCSSNGSTRRRLVLPRW